LTPKYRGKMLVDDVAMICEGIICKTCVEMDIQVIEIAVNPDHVHIFFKYSVMKAKDSRFPIKRGTPSRLKSGILRTSRREFR
jgi:putative transposase